MDQDFWWQHSENHATYKQQGAHEFLETRTICKLKFSYRLLSWWQHSENHATYEQQGAREFFILMLDRIHDKKRKASLAIKSREDFGSKSSKPIESLVGCLDLFTRPEKLGSDQKLYSENCQEKQDTLKQISIKKLPLVLCIHIKWFKHSPTRKMSKKINRHVQFLFSFDMKPYFSSSIIWKRNGNRIFSFYGDESDYKCHDAWITEVNEEVVKASHCYLMYYVQKLLYQESCEDVSCQLMFLRADTSVLIVGIVTDLWTNHASWPFHQLPRSYNFLVKYDILCICASIVHQSNFVATSI
ncbi:hypothetical protein H5410_041653 [Solanum commersonii]|uniref:USP domain-containing protein n=1 Tax=Solanum commersonii TaxID=4109 RepID=A0A9J5XS67_SOLCO|nr:hypothetical protein H5410_041653 [Solanum commersonii]